jgi:two-component system, chemotaxis family, sensor kinase CheA
MPDSDLNSSEFFAQFLDEYYAECDEHLTLLRRNLLALETRVGQPQVDRALLDELFRSFHTIKGVSGMVGLSAAEELAHQMESYLRDLRQGEIVLSLNGVEALISGLAMLEHVINARRNESALPRIDLVIAQLEAVALRDSSRVANNFPDEGESALPADAQSEQARASGPHGRTWRVEFVPSSELSERGVNVNSIRQRLMSIGELVSVTPQVREQGEIAFHFLMVTSVPESDFAEWRQDNMTFIPVTDAASQGFSGEATPVMVEPDTSESTSAVNSLLPPANVVRVDLARLDELMRIIGELVISRARLKEQLLEVKEKLSPVEWRTLSEVSLSIDRELRDLRHGVMRVRMVPVGEIFDRMQFIVRDLARENSKKIRIELIGRETEIDKFLVERMLPPLMHLVRNAVTHGFEADHERLAQGKTAESKLVLQAATIGESVVIEIADDGRGIDRERVAARAKDRGLIDSNTPLDDTKLLEVICSPGFSTRDQIDRGSGRGVGMDVVRNTVEELGGTLALETDIGVGTRFTIKLPLTLAIADAIIVSVNGQKFAVPQSALREVMEVESSSIKVLENNEIISYRGGVLPLVRLARLFDMADKRQPKVHVFVVGEGANAMGVAVDRILGQREIVVRGIGDPLVQVPGVAGATDLGDDRIVLILDMAGLRQSLLTSKFTQH